MVSVSLPDEALPLPIVILLFKDVQTIWFLSWMPTTKYKNALKALQTRVRQILAVNLTFGYLHINAVAPV